MQGDQSQCNAYCGRWSNCYVLYWPDSDPDAYYDENFGSTVVEIDGAGFADTFAGVEEISPEDLSARLHARDGCLLCEHAFVAHAPTETCAENEEYNRGFRWGVATVSASGELNWITGEIWAGASSLSGNYLERFPDANEVGFDCPALPDLECPP